MQIVLFVSVLVVAASAAPPAVLERSDSGNPSANYESRFLTEHGIKSVESGRLIPSLDGMDMTLVKEGMISYPTPEGKIITLSYYADETGYHPKGDHLPTPVLAMPISYV